MTDPTKSAATEPLYWHCATCGDHEAAQPEYAHGDWEKCACGDKARVMTLKEGAAIEQRIALGGKP